MSHDIFFQLRLSNILPQGLGVSDSFLAEVVGSNNRKALTKEIFLRATQPKMTSFSIMRGLRESLQVFSPLEFQLNQQEDNYLINIKS